MVTNLQLTSGTSPHVTGCNIWYTEATSATCTNCDPDAPSHKDTLFANFKELRFFVDYTDSTSIAAAHTAMTNAISWHGIRWVYGLYSTNITNANWADYHAAVDTEATWAQANGIYEFMIGNEAEQYLDDMSQADLITNMKALATSVQAIFTNGNVSYVPLPTAAVYAAWITAGRGDIDLIGGNIYWNDITTTTWSTIIAQLVTGFTAANVYISEFNIHGNTMDTFSSDPNIQTMAVETMVAYFYSLGLTRIFWLQWHDWSGGTLGLMKTDGTFKNCWNTLFNNYTADLCSGGTITVDSGANEGYLVDDNVATFWTSNLAVATHWMKYDFGASVSRRIGKLKILQASGRGMTNFYVASSPNNSDWTNWIINQDSSIFPSGYRVYHWDNPSTFHRYWQVVCLTAENEDGGISVGEIEFMEQSNYSASRDILTTTELPSLDINRGIRVTADAVSTNTLNIILKKAFKAVADAVSTSGIALIVQRGIAITSDIISNIGLSLIKITRPFAFISNCISNAVITFGTTEWETPTPDSGTWSSITKPTTVYSDYSKTSTSYTIATKPNTTYTDITKITTNYDSDTKVSTTYTDEDKITTEWE